MSLLTSLGNVQSFLSAAADETTLLNRLIAAASAQIETYCQRIFATAEYLAWLDGIGSRNEDMAPYLGYVQWPDIGHHRAMWLPNYPITAVNRCCVDRRDCLTIVNTSPDAAYAVVTAAPTGLVMVVGGGASAGTSSAAYANYTTISSLAAAVNAAGSNWSATIAAGASPWPSTEIRPIMSAGCFNAPYTLDAPGLPMQDLEVDAPSGRIWRQAGWPEGKRNIFVDYTGGYPLATDGVTTAVPSDLEQCCIELVAELWNATEQDTNLKTFSLQGFSQSAKTLMEKSHDWQVRLTPYRRIIL